MQLPSLLLSLLLLVRPGAPPVPKATVAFEIKNAGLTVQGRFSELDATVQFDPAHLAQARIRATVPVRTLDTGIGLRDRHLQKPEYFDAAQFPLITLESKSFRQTGSERYEGVFTLTLKGVAREVRLPFATPDGHEFRGTLQLNRLDYGVGGKSLLLGREVLVTLAVRV